VRTTIGRSGTPPSRAARRFAVAVVALLSAASSVAGQDRDVILRAEFPVDLASPPSVLAFRDVADPGYVARVPDGEAASALLAEARWTFSGMIWGFSYSYTPSDRARSIDERFELAPLAPEASAAMMPRAVAARLDGTVLYATVEFYPDASQRAELASWKASSAAAQGRGRAPFLAPGARRLAVEDAVREALRAYLRQVTHNKPREVRGTVALAAPPRLSLLEGSWVASARVLARVDEIVSYGAY